MTDCDSGDIVPKYVMDESDSPTSPSSLYGEGCSTDHKKKKQLRKSKRRSSPETPPPSPPTPPTPEESTIVCPEVIDTRPTWSHSAEFLMSCIAMSVGLGNIWRFPLTAYENGGGAFLIPYAIVLIVVGLPMYYLEMLLGQFSGRNHVRLWSLSPAMTGVGYGQIVATFSVVTYYVALMSLTVFYMVQSFSKELPWANCLDEWGPDCFAASSKVNTSSENRTSSSEYYFMKAVLKQYDTIEDGIGIPDWRLACCLLFSWLCIFLVMMNGVKTSGKASYFMALFPYVILLTILIKAATLEGAGSGVLFFIKSDWSKLLHLKVWYDAVTQVFFSLTVSIGAIIMYASFNRFRQPLLRDMFIVVSLDTFTSLIAGFTIFAILGNLAHEKGLKDVKHVIGSGTNSLAFISYPDAIAKFDEIPQVFSVLFFLMLWVLGLGSAVSYQSSIVTVMSDQYKQVSYWKFALASCILSFLPGLLYITPGGQHILHLVDHFGGTLLVLVLALAELVGICWIYGLENVCEDFEFMTGKKVSFYWRWCWGLLTPLILIAILLYAATHLGLTYLDTTYPFNALVGGWVLTVFGLIQLPFWMLIVFIQRRKSSVRSVKTIFHTTTGWGPKDTRIYLEWMLFKDKARRRKLRLNLNFFKRCLYSLNGSYRAEDTQLN